MKAPSLADLSSRFKVRRRVARGSTREWLKDVETRSDSILQKVGTSQQLQELEFRVVDLVGFARGS